MAGYVYIWEYRVPEGSRADFVRHYGPDGPWVQLFRRADGYLETTLVRDQQDPGRFLTIDHWQSEAAFEAFRTVFAEEFEALDGACARLTSSEHALGRYDVEG